MFDLKGFRKDRKMSQKQISEIIGIGTSFISQIETGKDPMPAYIPEKLAEAFGKSEVEKYFRTASFSALDAERGRKKYLFPNSILAAKLMNDNGESDNFDLDEESLAGKSTTDAMDRILLAIERRDELAFQQQREFERQGARIDELLAMMRNIRG
jgi:transcriptional regulator with XRE-family HTH domain